MNSKNRLVGVCRFDGYETILLNDDAAKLVRQDISLTMGIYGSLTGFRLFCGCKLFTFCQLLFGFVAVAYKNTCQSLAMELHVTWLSIVMVN